MIKNFKRVRTFSTKTICYYTFIFWGLEERTCPVQNHRSHYIVCMDGQFLTFDSSMSFKQAEPAWMGLIYAPKIELSLFQPWPILPVNGPDSSESKALSLGPWGPIVSSSLSSDYKVTMNFILFFYKSPRIGVGHQETAVGLAVQPSAFRLPKRPYGTEQTNTG